MANKTKAQVEAELADLHAEHAKLKADVVRKVNELTDLHGWCDEAKNALRELGLASPEIRVTLTITNPELLAKIANDKAGMVVVSAEDIARGQRGEVDTALLYAIEGTEYDEVVEVDRDSVEVVKADAR
jgi:hypothetical protein